TFNSIMNQVFGGIVMLWTDHKVDPLNSMQSMIDLGNRFQLYGMTSYAVSTAVGGAVSGDSIAGMVMNKIPLIGGAVTGLITAAAGLAGSLSLAIVAAGAVHAYVLPMIPYITMLFFVASMLLLLVEALV